MALVFRSPPRSFRARRVFLVGCAMSVTIFSLVSLLLLFAVFCDWRTREIPNWISIGIFLVAVGAAVWGIGNIRWWMVLSGGTLGMAIGLALFRWAHFGGGDAKLIAAIGALLGPVGLFFMLFWMALAGGLLALIALARRQGDYAYGPAIAAGYAAYLVYPGGVFSALITG